MIKKIVTVFRNILFVIPICYLIYDSKYLTGKYFRVGKFHGIGAIGWEWAYIDLLARFFLKVNHGVPWPISSRINIIEPLNIKFHPDDINNFQGLGNYFQAMGKITIGRGTWIAGNVGIITSNHTIGNLEEHDEAKEVILGERCWIGMNSMILPGVILGNDTVVGAGSIVSKSFPEGNCVIAGNPAKLIKLINQTY